MSATSRQRVKKENTCKMEKEYGNTLREVYKYLCEKFGVKAKVKDPQKYPV